MISVILQTCIQRTYYLFTEAITELIVNFMKSFLVEPILRIDSLNLFSAEPTFRYRVMLKLWGQSYAKFTTTIRALFFNFSSLNESLLITWRLYIMKVRDTIQQPNLITQLQINFITLSNTWRSLKCNFFTLWYYLWIALMALHCCMTLRKNCPNTDFFSGPYFPIFALNTDHKKLHISRSVKDDFNRNVLELLGLAAFIINEKTVRVNKFI